MDSDDEVRDRATFYMNVLQQKQKALNAAYIFNGKDTDPRGIPQSGTLIFDRSTVALCRSQVCLFPSRAWRSPCTSTR